MIKRWNLIDARESRGLNQRALSKIIQKVPTTTCDIECGMREPNEKIQTTLEEYFSIPREKLFELYERETAEPIMKNSYDIRGEVTAIHLRNKLGEIVNEAIVDTDDLERLIQFPVSWHCLSNKKHNLKYARTMIKGKVVHMHRFILGAREEFLTDHINHNGLDNRKNNLREATIAENNQNKTGANKNSKSGIRGVTYSKRHGKRWVANIRVNSKRKELGRYETKEEAETAVKEARKNNMPFSQEALSS